MISQKHTILGGIAAITLGIAFLAPAETKAQDAGDPQDMEVLTRGPVHEAFAGTVSYNPEPGIVITAQVPETIEEVPPEHRLEGDNVAWIPGYWAWDEEQNDFLWISGVWRNLPPGRQWVPGYWNDVDGGYQWTSGYWEDAEVTETTYLPEPPRTLEAGPNVAAPTTSHTWIPGNWIWRDTRYAWRAGYWTPVRADWIWVPGHYRWTHRGYIYVDGYWDYAVARRGVLFAPVHFHHHAYRRPGFYYSPATVISLVVFSNHLFLRPNYCHYYFGDYYAPRYRDSGYFVSFSYHSSRRGYDPIYSHYRWENRNVRNWERQRREYYEFRRDHEDARPPRTWAALNALPRERRGSRTDYAFAERLSSYTGSRDAGERQFRRVDKNERERITAQSREVKSFARERRQRESRREAASAGDTTNSKVARAKFSRSPVVAKVNERSDKSVAPPKRLQRRAAEQDTATPDRRKSERAIPRERQTTEQTRRQRTQPQRKEALTQRKEAQPQRKEAQPQRKEAQPQRKEAQPQRKQAQLQRKEVQTQRKQAQPQRKEVQTQRKEALPQRKQAQSQRKEAQSQRKEAQPQRKEAQPQRKQAQPQRKQAQPQRQQAQPQRQQAQPQRQQAQPQRKQAQPQRKQAQPQRQQAQPQRQQARPERQQLQRQQVQRQREQPRQASQPQRASSSKDRSRSNSETSGENSKSEKKDRR